MSDMREWLSWWSTTLPRSGPRVRVPSRALYSNKKDIQKDVLFCLKRAPPGLEGSRSTFHSGRRKTDVPRTSCAVSRSINKNVDSVLL